MSIFDNLDVEKLLSEEVESFIVPDDENGEFGSFVPSFAKVGKVIRTTLCYSVFCPDDFELSELPSGSVRESFTNTNRYYIPKDDVARNQFKSISGLKEDYRYSVGFLFIISTSSLLNLTAEQMERQKGYGDFIYKFLPYSTSKGKNWYWPLLGLPALYSGLSDKEYNLYPFNKAPLTENVEEDKKKYHYDSSTLPLDIIPGGKDSGLEVSLKNYKQSEMWKRASEALNGDDPYTPNESDTIKKVLLLLQHNKLKGCYIQFGDVYDHTPYGVYNSGGEEKRNQYPIVTKVWQTKDEAQAYLDKIKKDREGADDFDFGEFDPMNFITHPSLIELKNNFGSANEAIDYFEGEDVTNNNLQSTVHGEMTVKHLRDIWDKIG